MARTSGTADFDISRVISRGFGLIGSNAGLFLGLALLLLGLPNLLFGLWVLQAWGSPTAPFESLRDAADDRAAWLGVGQYLAAALVVMVLSYAALQAALVHASVRKLAGEEPGLGETLSRGLRLTLPVSAIIVLLWIALILVVVAIMVPMAIAAGLLSMALGVFGVVLILLGYIPALLAALYLYVRWSVAVPAYVAEQIGLLESFGRSRELTKGARFRLFVVQLVVAIFSWVLAYLSTMIAEAAATIPMIGVGVGTIITTLTGVAGVAIQASSYVELRDVKEGVVPGELEAIFG